MTWLKLKQSFKMMMIMMTGVNMRAVNLLLSPAETQIPISLYKTE